MFSRGIAFPVFVALLVFAHLVLHVALGYGAYAPDLITVAVLLAARRTTAPRAALLALLLGLLADSFALTGFGATAVALVVVGWLGARTRDLFEGESYAFALVYLFLGKWLASALHLLISPTSRAALPRGALVTALPIFALITAAGGLVALLLYRLSVDERHTR